MLFKDLQKNIKSKAASEDFNSAANDLKNL